MSGVKVDVAWSPVHDDLFLRFKTDINLYKTEPIEDNTTPKAQGMKISEDTFASLVSTNAEHQYIKCIAWYPKPEPANLCAVGLANGRVVLTSFSKNVTSDPHRVCGKEFAPKHPRQCSYLAWNPVESNLLAEGLERYKTDFSVLIWDVYQLQRGHDWTPHRSDNTPHVIQKPMFELGSGETTLSLSWFSREPQSLVTGMNNKFLRIFDLRDVSRPQNAAYTKAVYGVKVDPLSPYRLASFHDTTVAIWDTRNFEKPISTLSESKSIVKLNWSPTRPGLLGCLCKDSSVVKLYDIQHSVLDEIEPTSSAERRITAPDSQVISSFDWHPTQENRLLLVSPNGAVSDIKISERIALTWSPDVFMTWVCSRTLSQAHTIKVCREANEDISMLMRRRAAKGYGIQKDLSENGRLVGDDVVLRSLWRWIKYIKDLTLSKTSEVHANSVPAHRLYRGIKSLLCDSLAGSDSAQSAESGRSQLEMLPWETGDGYRSGAQRKVHRSTERVKALELCGWTYSKDETSSPIIDKLESDHQYERSAAIAVFNLKLSRAIEVLHKGSVYYTEQNVASPVNLSMVAMALSGFSDDKDTMWRDVSTRLGSQFSDAYLRNMFLFLTADSENYDTIVNDVELDVSDRVALASLYLPDNKLTEFIEKLMLNLTAIGDLNGLLLTGFSRECLDLFQNYVDSSGDVQTAAVALVQALPNSELSGDPRTQVWLETYRELLDVWRLWHQRAEFDVYRQACESNARGAPRIQPQVFVSCNFCGKSVSFNSLTTRSRTMLFGGMTAHKPRVTSCPSCRKPLPRCALCLINMGTSAGVGKSGQEKELDATSERMAKFADWFTWCQSCRHGGHAEHMTQWFSDHKECPVTGCSCKCSSLDAISHPATDVSSHPTS